MASPEIITEADNMVPGKTIKPSTNRGLSTSMFVCLDATGFSHQSRDP